MVLYINSCPRKESRTKRIAEALLQKLGNCEETDLYDIELLPLDEERLNKRNELLAEGRLDDEEFALARQFAEADTIVIAAPFWDQAYPSKLRTYIENIYIQGIVSVYNEQGIPSGLCKGRVVYYVTTAGGPYDGRYSFEYVKTLCTDYFGIPEVRLIKAEMLDIIGNDSDEIVDSVIKTILTV